MNKQSAEEWILEKEALDIRCACGCDKPIKILISQRGNGIPKYLVGHFGRGKPLSPERKKNISDSLLGKTMSDDFKEKRRAHMISKWENEEYAEKMKNVSKMTNADPERRAQQSEFMIDWIQRHPEHREKISKAAKKWASENPDRKIQAAKAGHRAVAVSQTPSSIELLLLEEFKRRGLSFEFQWEYKLGIADFKLGNTVVFADGNYWHNFPEGWEKDKIQTEYLQQLGFRVLRFWESELNSDLKACVDRILENN